MSLVIQTVARSIVPGSSKVVITHGDGVEGNPTIDIDASQLGLGNSTIRQYLDADYSLPATSSASQAYPIGLEWEAGPNEAWKFRFLLAGYATSGCNLRPGIDAPSGSSVFGEGLTQAQGTGTYPLNLPSINGYSPYLPAIYEGIVKTGENGGTVSLKLTGDGYDFNDLPYKLLAGTSLEAFKIEAV